MGPKQWIGRVPGEGEGRSNLLIIIMALEGNISNTSRALEIAWYQGVHGSV